MPEWMIVLDGVPGNLEQVLADAARYFGADVTARISTVVKTDHPGAAEWMEGEFTTEAQREE